MANNIFKWLIVVWFALFMAWLCCYSNNVKHKMDKQLMEYQEKRDYERTQAIMSDIFSNCTLTMTQEPIYSHVDARMVVTKGKTTRHYTVEIKERQQDMDKYHTLPLTVKKYCNIKDETQPNEKPLVIYLLNGKYFYIFDLNSIDLNGCNIRNWSINKVEFTNNPEKEKQPTIFIPIEQAVFNGSIH